MSAIGYKGTITIVKRFKGKYMATEHYHNNGTPELFKYLCQYLWNGAPSSDDKGGIPYYLDVAQGSKQEDKSIKYTSILNSKVFTYEAEGINDSYNSNSSPSITKVFYLTSSSFKAGSGSETDDSDRPPLYLLLYHSASATKPLATIPLVKTKSTTSSTGSTETGKGNNTSNFEPLKDYSIAEGESHEIMWKMEFKNYEDNTLVVGGGKS